MNKNLMDIDIKNFSESIDDRIYALILTQMYLDGKKNIDIDFIAKFNIKRAEQAERRVNELIDRIKEIGVES